MKRRLEAERLVLRRFANVVPVLAFAFALVLVALRSLTPQSRRGCRFNKLAPIHNFLAPSNKK
jgi:hypothetical protein